MKHFIALCLLVVALGVIVVTAQTQSAASQAPAQVAAPAPAAAPVDPASAALKTGFDRITLNLSESAVKMPQEHYTFKPTPEVMSFAELLGHVANTHYSYCSRVKGEKNPNTQALEKVTAKDEMVKAFNASVDYCKAVYGSMTDAKLLTQPIMGADGQPTLLNGQPMVPYSTLVGNLTHDWEHYGNIVTYLRIKGLVPPSTERAQRGRSGRGGM